jgi:hypothetical protein
MVFAFLVPLLGKAIAAYATAAIIGAGIGAAGYTASIALSNGGFNNWNWGQFAKAVGIGAVSGAITAGIGNTFGNVGAHGISGEFVRAGAHGFANGFIAEFTGGDFMQGFASGGLGSLAGSGFQSLGGIAKTAVGMVGFSAVAGGIGAELSGGDFWKGAAIGGMVAGLNHLAHEFEGDPPIKKVDKKGYLSQNGKKITDGFGTAITATDGIAIALATGELSPEALKSMKGFLKVTGKAVGLVAAGDDLLSLYNKGSAASIADWTKAGISVGSLFVKANPWVLGGTVLYGLADAAGYNVVDIVYNKFK